VFGAIVVAKPETVLNQRWLALIERLLIAFAGGVLVAAAFAWYSSRRITTPVLQLSEAADEVAQGNYDVEVPSGGAGEIGLLADRFRADGLAARRDRGARAQLPDDGLPRAANAADRDSRPRRRAPRGRRHRRRAAAASLTVIAAEAERLERLVGDVLDLAKLDAHRFTVLQEEVDMERLVERAYVTFSEEARRRGIDYRQGARGEAGDRLRRRPRPADHHEPALRTPSAGLPDGGSVGLELTATDGSVYVGVADSGPGIPPSERERIFRPFWSRGGGGTGLGLPIARELAAALGGRISLESSAETGSRFELMLPTRPR
jgi:signal transduction histidine kinase